MFLPQRVLEHEDFAVCPLQVMAVARTEAEQVGSFLPFVAFFMNRQWRVAAMGVVWSVRLTEGSSRNESGEPLIWSC